MQAPGLRLAGPVLLLLGVRSSRSTCVGPAQPLLGSDTTGRMFRPSWASQSLTLAWSSFHTYLPLPEKFMGRPHVRAHTCTVPKGPSKQLPLSRGVALCFTDFILPSSFVKQARGIITVLLLSCPRGKKNKQGKFFLLQESNYLLGEPWPIYISKERDTWCHWSNVLGWDSETLCLPLHRLVSLQPAWTRAKTLQWVSATWLLALVLGRAFLLCHFCPCARLALSFLLPVPCFLSSSLASEQALHFSPAWVFAWIHSWVHLSAWLLSLLDCGIPEVKVSTESPLYS